MFETVLTALPAFLGAALALMATPGPVTLASAAAGAAWPGRATGFVLAMSAGTLTVITLVALGVTGLLTSVPGAAPVVGALGAAYVLYLAWKIATAPPIGSAGAAPPPSLAGAYAMAIANPKAWGAFAALFSGFPLVPGDPVATGVVKVGILYFLPPAINLTWMVVGTRLARAISDPVTGRMVNRVMAVLLVASVAAAFLL